MYTGLLHLHSLLRWIILILLLIAIAKSLSGMMGKKSFTAGDKKIGLFLMISAHLSLLIGFYQWFTSPVWGFHDIQAQGMGEVMIHPINRFWAIEHLTGMLLAIILITIGKRVAKMNISDQSKHGRTFWYYFTAFIIILVSVPWPFRVEGISRSIFPGM